VKRLGIAIAIIVVAIILAGIGYTLYPETPPGPPAPAYASPLTGTVIGVREADAPKSYALVQTFQRATGVHPRVVVYYSSWWEPFRTSYAEMAYRHHAVVLVQLEPYNVPVSRIADGSQDWYLRRYAEEVRRFGHLVILSFAPEMNGNWSPWDAAHHTPPDVWVAAWRHIVTLFRSRGARNVTWLWDASSGVHPPEGMLAWWPGDQYVDWVGLDGYYYRRSDNFISKFADYINAVRRITAKPILLAEVGIGPVAGKARMLPDLFGGIRKYQLLGLVWFDVNQHKPPVHQDWRLEGNRTALAEFHREVAGLQAAQAATAGKVGKS
jgi:hypothetical protein